MDAVDVALSPQSSPLPKSTRSTGGVRFLAFLLEMISKIAKHRRDRQALRMNIKALCKVLAISNSSTWSHEAVLRGTYCFICILREIITYGRFGLKSI